MENDKMITLNNVLSRNTLHPNLRNIYNNGLPHGYDLGLENLDNIFRFDFSKLVTITGIPNMGKSEFVDFICTQLNKKYGFKTLYYSPENQPIELHLSKIVSKITGKKFNNKEIESDDFQHIGNYIYDNFFFMNYDSVFSLDDVLNIAESMIIEKGIKVLVIDSYNKLESAKPYNISETDYISKVLDRLERFSKKYNILLILVAHPRKMEKDEHDFYKCPRPYDIAGSANFFNKSDYCLTVHRDFNTDTTLIKVDKVKFKNYGGIGETNLGYDYKSGNFFDVDVNVIDMDSGKFADKYVPDNFKVPELKFEDLKDYLDITVSYFDNINDTIPKDVNLKEFLFSNKNENLIDYIREPESLEERKKRKKECDLPCISISSRMEGYKDSAHIVEKTNLICIDIDYKDNSEIFSEIPLILKRIDNVAYFSKSVTGMGYFAIIPISNSDKFKQHYYALYNDFKKLGITLDKQCSDLIRVRYDSLDYEDYVNYRPDVYIKIADSMEDNNKKQQTKNRNKSIVNKPVSISETDLNQLKDLCKRVEENEYNICNDYTKWFEIGCALANTMGESGRNLYHTLSKFDRKYNKYDTDNQYDNCIESDNTYNYNIGTIFHYYNEFINNNKQ